MRFEGVSQVPAYVEAVWTGPVRPGGPAQGISGWACNSSVAARG
jgi:hypothetical protein